MLRLATLADFDFIYDLYFLPETNAYLLYEPMDKATFLPIFSKLIDARVKYVFEPAGEPVGMVKLLPLTHRTSHVLYVGGFAIHPAKTQRGYGFALLQAVKDWAKPQGFTRLELDVDADNTVAKHLYEKAGFVQEGILRNYAFRQKIQQYFDNFRMAFLITNQS